MLRYAQEGVQKPCRLWGLVSSEELSYAVINEKLLECSKNDPCHHQITKNLHIGSGQRTPLVLLVSRLLETVLLLPENNGRGEEEGVLGGSVSEGKAGVWRSEIGA